MASASACELFLAVLRANMRYAGALRFSSIHLLERQLWRLGDHCDGPAWTILRNSDDLLATPDVAHPLAVVQPKVLYKFADPALEKLSAGQKIMLRMGADHMARAKILLIAIRGELLGRSRTN